MEEILGERIYDSKDQHRYPPTWQFFTKVSLKLLTIDSIENHAIKGGWSNSLVEAIKSLYSKGIS